MGAVALAAPAVAQTIAVTAPGSIPDFGNVTAAISGTTEFRVSTGGTVTVANGTGTRQSVGSVSNTVTVTCSGGSNAGSSPCNATNVIVRVTPGVTLTGRAQTVNGLLIAMGTAAQVVAPSYNGEAVTFTIGPIGRNNSKTFLLGLDLPITGGFGSSGLASASYTVEAGFTPTLTAAGAGTARATTRNGMLIQKASDLEFGVVLPFSGQTGTVTINQTTGERTSSNPTGVLLRSGISASRAVYSLDGEGGQILSVSVPSSFQMTGPGSPITVTTSNTSGGSVTVSGSAGTAGTASVGVGGSLTVTGPVTAGAYSGSFDVVFTWN